MSHNDKHFCHQEKIYSQLNMQNNNLKYILLANNAFVETHLVFMVQLIADQLNVIQNVMEIRIRLVGVTMQGLFIIQLVKVKLTFFNIFN